MRESLLSRKYTVKSLTEIAERMGITVDRKFRKEDIVNVILAQVETAHAEALAENENREILALAQDGNYLRGTDGSKFQVETAHAEALAQETRLDAQEDHDFMVYATADMSRKVNNYMRFNGTDKLTPAQWRRVRKGLRKAGLSIGQLSLTYP